MAAADTNVVLDEVMWVLSSVHEFGRADVSDFVEMLLATDGFELQDPLAVKDALDTHRASKAEFSTASCSPSPGAPERCRWAPSTGTSAAWMGRNAWGRRR